MSSRGARAGCQWGCSLAHTAFASTRFLRQSLELYLGDGCPLHARSSFSTFTLGYPCVPDTRHTVYFSCVCAVCWARSAFPSPSFLGRIPTWSSRLVEFCDAFLTCLLKSGSAVSCAPVYPRTHLYDSTFHGVCVCVYAHVSALKADCVLTPRTGEIIAVSSVHATVMTSRDGYKAFEATNVSPASSSSLLPVCVRNSSISSGSGAGFGFPKLYPSYHILIFVEYYCILC